MEFNIALIGVLIILVIPFVFFIIRRNRKDQRDMEDDFNKREVNPEKHHENHI